MVGWDVWCSYTKETRSMVQLPDHSMSGLGAHGQNLVQEEGIQLYKDIRQQDWQEAVCWVQVFEVHGASCSDLKCVSFLECCF